MESEAANVLLTLQTPLSPVAESQEGFTLPFTPDFCKFFLALLSLMIFLIIKKFKFSSVLQISNLF